MYFLYLIAYLIFIPACNNVPKMNTNKTSSENIIEAVMNNRLDVVEAALKNGANVNTRNQKAASLLLLATRANHLDMAKLLVAHKADVNSQDDRLDSPFLYAGASGYLELVRLFLANGARFDIFNRYNGTALIPACERGHLEVAKLLAFTNGYPIDHVNRLGWTALMEAVVLGDGSDIYAEVVQVLVDADCNVNIADKEGITALQNAGSKGYKKIVDILERAPRGF